MTLLRPRRRLWFVLLAGVVLGSGSVWWVSTQLLWVNSARAVEKGMKIDEAVSKIGRPPDQTFAPTKVQTSWNDMFGNVRFHRTPGCLTWNAIDGVVRCSIEDGRVVSVEIQETGLMRTQLQRLREMIGG